MRNPLPDRGLLTGSVSGSRSETVAAIKTVLLGCKNFSSNLHYVIDLRLVLLANKFLNFVPIFKIGFGQALGSDPDTKLPDKSYLDPVQRSFGSRSTTLVNRIICKKIAHLDKLITSMLDGKIFATVILCCRWAGWRRRWTTRWGASPSPQRTSPTRIGRTARPTIIRSIVPTSNESGSAFIYFQDPGLFPNTCSGSRKQSFSSQKVTVVSWFFEDNAGRLTPYYTVIEVRNVLHF
jgi:hypothetical protein